MKKQLFLVYLLFLFFVGLAQNNNPIKNVALTNIGPSIMSGRITAIAVNNENPTEFYVAYASGGLWFTNNNGTTFTPVMDNSETQNIGALAVDFKNDIIWVGTGENNSSRSSYAGIGLLKSTDKGKTWQNMGLTDSHHIGKIILNPTNKDEVVVGVLGHLYSPNKERGVFKTIDGGKTWNQTLFINEDTGIIDISLVPNKSNILYAAAWERERKAWNFKGSGKSSAIYKSTDFGKSWEKITTKTNGFPVGDGLGRIGVSAFDENTVYAILDNQFRKIKKDDNPKTDELQKDSFKNLTKETFLVLDDEKLNNFLKNNGFPEKYDAKSVKKLIKKNKIKPLDLIKYLDSPNTQLFDTLVKGAEVYRSDDGGKTWKKTHVDYVDGLYFSYGYYFGKIHVDNHNKDKIYIYGVPILKSEDGGKTFTSISKENVHADHHDLWINPNLKGHLIVGNDGGINISYDDGKNWIKANNPAVGQFYTVNVDQKKPYNVYGGLQDNGVWTGSNRYKKSVSWHQTGKYPYHNIMRGDGMQIAIDSENDYVYTGFQFGNYFRINAYKDYKSIQPKHDLGDSPLRFNWQTPIQLSSHNSDILYVGSNKLHRSMKNGEDYKTISDDLTLGGKQGNVPFGTLTTISESPFEFGLIYTGSDDGLVYVTKNSGSTWTNISDAFPKNLWVSRIIASQHKKERVYVTLNGYRNDDFTTYVYVSENYGASFTAISSGLPNFPVNVIKEDSKDENILYLGNDNGVFTSFNKGLNWSRLDEDLPKVAVHDMVIQKEANDLIVATHGRSLYKINLNILQEFNQVKDKEIAIFNLNAISFSNRWGNKRFGFSKINEPEFKIPFYANTSQNVVLTIKNVTSSEVEMLVFKEKFNVEKGINYYTYDLSISEKVSKKLVKKDKTLKIEKRKNNKYYLPKGNYKVEINGVSKTFDIE